MSVTVQVSGGPPADDPDLAGLAAKLAAKDATLWGPVAEAEASVRLGWLDLPR